MTINLRSSRCKNLYWPKKRKYIDGLDMVVYTAAIHPDNRRTYGCKRKKYTYYK